MSSDSLADIGYEAQAGPTGQDNDSDSLTKEFQMGTSHDGITLPCDYCSCKTQSNESHMS